MRRNALGALERFKAVALYVWRQGLRAMGSRQAKLGAMTMRIKRIEEDPAGRLLVIPESDDCGYQFIYRAGNGLRWEPATGARVAYEPCGWDHDELLRHIVSTAKSGLGVMLVNTRETEWKNVSDVVSRGMRRALRLSAFLGKR